MTENFKKPEYRANPEMPQPAIDREFPLELIRDAYYLGGPEDSPGENALRLREDMFGKYARLGFLRLAQEASLFELAEALELAGRVLLPGRVFAGVLAGILLRDSGGKRAKEELLKSLADGRISLGVALDLRRPWFSSRTTVRAKKTKGGVELSGSVDFVPESESWIVPAELSRGKLVLVQVEASDLGVTRESRGSVDPSFSLNRIELKKSRLPLHRVCGTIDSAALGAFSAKASLLYAALAAGSVARTVEIAVDHAKRRKVAGGPIGKFQAISHKLVNNHIALEKLRSMVAYAATQWDHGAAAGIYVSMAKAAAERSFFEATQDAIQIHGAEAFQWQHTLNPFFRRALLTKTLFGKGDLHFDHIAATALHQTGRKAQRASRSLEGILPLASLDAAHF